MFTDISEECTASILRIEVDASVNIYQTAWHYISEDSKHNLLPISYN
jgi:hypothetical protein